MVYSRSFVAICRKQNTTKTRDAMLDLRLSSGAAIFERDSHFGLLPHIENRFIRKQLKNSRNKNLVFRCYGDRDRKLQSITPKLCVRHDAATRRTILSHQFKRYRDEREGWKEESKRNAVGGTEGKLLPSTAFLPLNASFLTCHWVRSETWASHSVNSEQPVRRSGVRVEETRTHMQRSSNRSSTLEREILSELKLMRILISPFLSTTKQWVCAQTHGWLYYRRSSSSRWSLIRKFGDPVKKAIVFVSGQSPRSYGVPVHIYIFFSVQVRRCLRFCAKITIYFFLLLPLMIWLR